ncbi:hypothetical protein Hanom_Chr06g00538101 [Helianthus anomalus]
MNEHKIFNNPTTTTTTTTVVASSGHQPPRSALYVGDLHPHTTDNDLHQILHDRISEFSSCLKRPTLAQIPRLRLFVDFSLLIRFCLLNCDLIEFEL